MCQCSCNTTVLVPTIQKVNRNVRMLLLLLLSCPSQHLFPTCGRMPLPSLSLWPGRQPCRPRLVDGRRGGGPSFLTPRSRNPPTELMPSNYFCGRKLLRDEIKLH